jgi:hypothetical protein
MQKESIIITLGLLIALVTFFEGVPQFWERAIVTSASLLIVIVAYFIKDCRSTEVAKNDTNSTFTQNSGVVKEVVSKSG